MIKNKIPRHDIDGILLLDKPLHLSSNAALQRVKNLFNAKKAGHTGSLDPLATGMLPLCFGKATKLAQSLLESNKQYQVTIKLGEKTKTGDAEGAVFATEPFDHVTEEKFVAALQKFLGETHQIPPMYSALKHQGKPLYELARQGIEVTRKPRPIQIYQIELQEFALPFCTFTVTCSKGTYIRTLAEDIAATLKTCAYVTALRRLTVAPFKTEQMISLTDLELTYKTQGLKLNNSFLPLELFTD